MSTGIKKKRLVPKVNTKTEQGRFWSSVLRTKKKIERCVNANFVDGRSSFVTFTFKDEILGYQDSLEYWEDFIRRFRREYPAFNKYLCVPEIQTGERRPDGVGRMVWHFHCIFFGVPYLNFEAVSSCWGHGAIHIKRLDSSRNVGLYISTYLRGSVGFGRKMYYCSRGLKREMVYYDSEIPSEVFATMALKRPVVDVVKSFDIGAEHDLSFVYKVYIGA